MSNFLTFFFYTGVLVKSKKEGKRKKWTGIFFFWTRIFVDTPIFQSRKSGHM